MKPLAATCWFVWSVSAAAVPPPDAQVLSRKLVVSGQGYFPVAIRLKDGRIAAVLRCGAPHLGVKGRLDVVFSSDDGVTWTKPTTVVDSPIDDRNPAFGQATDGTLVVGFWRTARYDDSGKYTPNATDKPVTTWSTRSTDGGKSWEEPSEIDVREIGWGSPYGKIVTMPGGSLLMPVYGEQPRSPGQTVKTAESWSYLFQSTDHGKTWRVYSTVGEKKFNETSVVLLRSGKMMAAMRSAAPEQAVWISESTNLGKSWSAPQRHSPDRLHPADLLELDDGRVLAVVGRRTGKLGVAAKVSDANLSFDARNAFPLIDDATNTDCGYPSSVLLPGGRALTLYYAVGRKGEPAWGTHCGAVTFKIPKAP